EAANMAQAPRMRIQIVGGHAYPRHIDLDPRISIPIALWDDVRIMRMGHRCDHAERAAIFAAGHVEELLERIEDDVIIEVDLVGTRTRARLSDGVHGVIPTRAVLEPSPVRCPAEVGGIDVGGQTLLESVQLIGAAKMHLAA